MKPSNETLLAFYNQLGRVFYGIAVADAVVRKEEIEILNKIVKDKWLPLDNAEDDFHTDAAYQIEIAFDWLLNNELVEGDILEEFEDFRTEHKSLFTPKVKKMILETVEGIADSFHGTNKNEKAFIKSLKSIIA